MTQSTATAQQKFVITPIGEKRLAQLPAGKLYWRVKNFPTLDQAKAAASKCRWNPDTVSYDGWPSMTAEVAGKAWLSTLGQKGAVIRGGTKVAEIGPVPPQPAPEYLLHVNYGSGPPRANTPVHAHSGCDAFYVFAGKLQKRTPHGAAYVDTGHIMNGHTAGMPMQVINAGSTDLNTLIMFVVDATKPFPALATLP